MTFGESFNQAVSCPAQLVWGIQSDDALERAVSTVKQHEAATDQKEQWMSKGFLFLQVIFLHLNDSVSWPLYKSFQ